MANVKINELPLIDDADESASLPIDNGIQTYRITLEKLKEILGSSAMPVGMQYSWPSDVSIPVGAVIENGQELSREVYSELFALIGTKYGAGDGVTTFNVRNMQGVSERGVGSQYIDGLLKEGPSEIGELQADQMQRLFGELDRVNQINNPTNTGVFEETYLINDLAGSGTSSGTRRMYDVFFDSGKSPNARVSESVTGETRASTIGTLFLIHAINTSSQTTTEAEVDVLNAEIQALKAKQNYQKSIKCIATQRTYNSTNAYQEMPADDDQHASALADNRRRLNYFKTNANDYFELINSGLVTNFIRIKKPGSYKIRFTSICMRTGVSTYCFIQVYDPALSLTTRFDRPANAAVSSANATAGNTLNGGGTFEVSFSSGTREISLWHFFGTRTVGFNYGRFGIYANSHTDTCSVEIELIEDI